jgi:predicted anti-sigma-YlaC factor YlaD
MREALSARLDGESLPSGVTETAVAEHLEACRGCALWLDEVRALSAPSSVQSTPATPDLAEMIAKRVPPVEAGLVGRGVMLTVLRVALIATALTELALTIPVLLLGHDREAPMHVAHEMGSFELALAIGFALAAIRPRLASGMTWLVAAAATSLGVTAISDLASGLTTASDETPHLVVILGAVLLWMMSRSSNPEHRPLMSRIRHHQDSRPVSTVGLRLVQRARLTLNSRVQPTLRDPESAGRAA